jgi:hypothetical protein
MRTSNIFKIAIGALVLGGSLMIISACGESTQDAGVGNRNIGNADLINMPDGYSNVAHKCDGPNMVYVIYHGSVTEGPKAYGSVAVVANDPRCTSSTAAK